MNHLPPLVMVLLAALVVVAGVYDIRFRRLPNWLTVSAFLVGVVLNSFLYGLPGLLFSLKGFGLAFLIYFPFYLARGMGAGDVKLMAAIGALVGPWNWLLIFICTGLLGLVFAVLMALSYGRLRETLWNFRYIVRELLHFRAPHASRPDLDVRNPARLRLPHGAVIALGTIGVLGFGRILQLF